MELGKGFAFVARQQRIVTDTSDFFIDLVFYNYYLKYFVLVNLKTHKLTHEVIVQMDMYVRMYNDLKKGVDDNPPIGIILWTEKDETVVNILPRQKMRSCLQVNTEYISQTNKN